MSENFTIKYTFQFESKEQKEFVINLDGKSLDLIFPPKQELPPWTELSCEQCSHCPLDPNEHKHCPVAKSLVEVIRFFSTLRSIEEVDLLIETEQRNYSKHTPLQSAVGSLIGIYMVSSGCPIMNKLRPMVRFHLPFASIDETIYRAISMYLTAQFLIHKQGKTPDWELNDLGKIYENVNKLNSHFIKRIRQIKIEDASLNAIVILDCFAQSVGFSVTEKMLDSLEALFHAYLE